MSCRWVEASMHDILSIKNSSLIPSPDWKLGFGATEQIGTSVDLWVCTLRENENVLVWNKFHILTTNKRGAKGEAVFSQLLKAGGKSPLSQYQPDAFGTIAAQIISDGTTAGSYFV